jgi:hypothetical protein
MHAILSRPCVAAFACFAAFLLSAPVTAHAAVDLTIPSLANPPAQLPLHAPIRPTVTVHDAGTSTAGRSRTGVWLSRDRVVGRDILLSATSTSRVRAGRSITIRPRLRLPAAVTAGRWYLVACADRQRAIRERSERNNCRVSRRAVHVVASNLTVTSPVAAQTTGFTTTLTWTSNVLLTVTCSVDGAAAAPCTSGATLTLDGGPHSVHVRGVDVAGTALTRDVAWTADVTAPSVGFTYLPADRSRLATDQFAFVADEAASFECGVDGAALVPCVSPVGLTTLSEGTHTFQLRATDAFGNVGAILADAWTVDLTAPVTSIGSKPASPTNSTAASFTFGAPDAAAYECSLDGVAASSCTSATSYSSLANGPHTFTVAAIDAAGNVDATPASWTWTVDTVPPIVTFDAVPTSGTTNSVMLFSTNEVSATTCSLNGAAPSSCASPTPFTVPSGIQNTFTVRATDAAGNVGTQSTTWSS